MSQTFRRWCFHYIKHAAFFCEIHLSGDFMPKSLALISRFLFLFIIIVFGKYVIAAQISFTGEWKADVRNTSDAEKNQEKINLFFRRERDGERHQNSANFKYSELKNLTYEQANKGGAVRFSLVREAGSIDCDGVFTDGRGNGTYRFAANQQFLAEMKKRGFDFEKPSERNRDNDTPENRLFTAMMVNVTTALADDLLAANFGKLDTGDLFKAAIFKIDGNFLREMKASNFPNLDFDDLVKARIFKIDGEYLRQLNASGFGKEPFENVVKMRIFKITPEYISSFRNSGFSNLTIDELQKLSIFKVTPEFIKEVRGEGLNNLSIEDLTKMKIFNINGEVIRKAKADNVDLKVESLVRYKIGGWTKRTNVVWN